MPDIDTSAIVEARDQIESLTLLLNETTSNVITFAVFHSVAEREAAVRSLKKRLTMEIKECPLSSNKKNPLELLKTIPVDKRICVFFYDVEAALPDFLGYVNYLREGYLEIPHALVFWVREPILKEIALKAPDFWSWRSGVFDFRSKTLERTQGIMQAAAMEGFSFLNKEDFDRKVNLYKGLIEEYSKQEKPDQKFLAELENKLAYAYREMAEYPQAILYAESAFKKAKKLGDTQLILNALNLKGETERLLGNYSEAKNTLTEALETAIESFDPQDTEIATCQSNLALVLQDLGQLNEARELLEIALHSTQKNLGPKHLFVAIYQSNLARVLKDLGLPEKAEALFRSALEYYQNNFEPHHPSIALIQSNLATVLQDLGQLDEAKTLLQQALKSDIKNFDQGHPAIATDQSNLAMVLLDLGHLEEARDLLRAALESFYKYFGTNHPSIAVSQSNLATVLRGLGQFAEARDLLRSALDIGQKNFEPGHISISNSQANLAMVLKSLGQLNEAKILLERAYQSLLTRFGPDYKNTKIVKRNLEIVLEAIEKQRV